MKKFKTYRLPLIERFGHHYAWLKSLFWLILACAIIIPVMAANNWNLWYLLYFLPFILLSILSIVHIGRWIYCNSRYKKWQHDVAASTNHSAIFGGPPGSCKTLTAVASIYEMAKYSWEELKWERWLILHKVSKKGYVLTDDDKEILDAYDFYTNQDGVPCLGSSIPIYSKTYKKYSYEFNMSHLTQNARVPYRMNALVDEIGTMTSVDGARKRQEGNSSVLKCADMFRFCRQFCELRLIGTEQDPKNVYIDVRRVQGENRIYKSHKEVLKPLILIWIFNKLKSFFANKDKATSYLFAKQMLRFKQFLRSNGFIEIRYRYSDGSVDSKETVKESESSIEKGQKGLIYLSCLQEWRYNSRVYRSAYQSIEKKLDMKPYDSLSLSKALSCKMLRSYLAKKET